MKNCIGLLLLLGALTITNTASAAKVKLGNWYTEFQLADGIILPASFFIEKTKKSVCLTIINGAEQILLNQIKLVGDSLFILFQTFDAELKIKIHTKTYLTGAWFNRAKSTNYNVPFRSIFEGESRYPYTHNQIMVEGKWEVTFDYKSNPEKAIGLFNYFAPDFTITQPIKTNLLSGTFLTETGDYRYLTGATVGDSLFLSTFDGSHAFLFRAQLRKDTLWGEFFSGKHYRTDWYALKNESFELTHPDSLTYVVNEEPISFELMKLDKSIYKYPNESLKNKVVLIQIMGTWCPNCLDESNYLRGINERYPNQLEVLAVTFETQKTTDEKIEKVKKYKDALNLNYTFLIGGDACKPCAADLFPQLSEIISFPTLIFIDKAGAIRKIHTGFSGPGTVDYYLNFVAETDAFIETLVNE